MINIEDIKNNVDSLKQSLSSLNILRTTKNTDDMKYQEEISEIYFVPYKEFDK